MEEMLGKLGVYTRTSDEGIYPKALQMSVHMAYSMDGIQYFPLNQNYGMFHGEASVSENNTLICRGVKHPCIIRGKDEQYVILAIEVGIDEEKGEEIPDRLVAWIFDGDSRYTKHISLGIDSQVRLDYVNGVYNSEKDGYEIYWNNIEGTWYSCVFNKLDASERQGNPKKVSSSHAYEVEKMGIDNIEAGNAIDVSVNKLEELVKRWTPIRNTGIEYPDKIQVKVGEALPSIKARALYSDGSFAEKVLLPNTKEFDLNQKGTYRVSGTVKQAHYPFPMAEGYADPQVFRYEGKYYFIATNDRLDQMGLYIRQGQTVQELFDRDAKEHKILDYSKEKDFIKYFWAPELHKIGDAIFVLFAVCGDVMGIQSFMMRLKKDGDLLEADGWEEPIRVIRKDNEPLAKEAITLDMTYVENKNQSYLIWSYRVGYGTPYDTGSMLLIGTVDKEVPWKLTSEPVLLSRPLYGWENHSKTLNNEGPFPLIRNDKLYIAYSGGAAGGYSYVVGLLRIDRDKDLLCPENWEKTSAPVLSHYTDQREYGPGHNTFFVDEDGNTMIVYHAQSSSDDEIPAIRCSAIRRVHFDKNQEPDFTLTEDRDLCESSKKVEITIEVK